MNKKFELTDWEYSPPKRPLAKPNDIIEYSGSLYKVLSVGDERTTIKCENEFSVLTEGLNRLIEDGRVKIMKAKNDELSRNISDPIFRIATCATASKT